MFLLLLLMPRLVGGGFVQVKSAGNTGNTVLLATGELHNTDDENLPHLHNLPLPARDSPCSRTAVVACQALNDDQWLAWLQLDNPVMATTVARRGLSSADTANT